MDDPIWIEVELAKAIHARQLSEHGGADGVRDEGLLKSALSRPRQLFAYSDPTPEIPVLAAALAFGIAKNHAFTDGNKRAALVISLTFMALNGYSFSASREDNYKMFLGLASGEVSEAELADFLGQHSKKL